VSDRPARAIAPSGRDAPAFEAYTVLAALATRTRTASLGALVTPVTTRNPAVLAKMVTTLDVLSGGRAVLGIGMGGAGDDGGTSVVVRSDQSRDDPGGPVGAGPPRPRPGDERRDRLAEALQICRAMFTDEAPTFEGRYYRIVRADNRPRPVRACGVPIMIDGEGDDDVLGLVARYGDALTVRGSPESVREALTTLDRQCDEVGRERAAISRIGVARLVIAPTSDEATERLDRQAATGGWRSAERAAALAGSPAAVAAQVAALVDVGVDGVVVTMADAHELELVELAGTTLRPLFG
jgi:alkanesulfonate monooxygenase SsuD/methylene tetrahydromethanopterin reductase-like flavin-dependent oxidoreductase (luciferase family)